MTDLTDDAPPARLRGFAAMPLERRREIAARGGRAVDPEKRAFSTNHALAVEAGAKGGKAPHKARPAPEAGE